MVVVVAIAWIAYHNVSTGITTSEALDGSGSPASTGTDQNILIMGLDSRRDQQGQPLPKNILDAMHAGDETSGSYDADVLIVVHVPAGDGPITAISIPRDDYVDLPGCPSSNCHDKIKVAYELAYNSAMNAQATGESQSPSTDAHDVATREQIAREAGRRAQISAVKHLLQIPIDHFVEITLGAFFQIARVVEPITVCLNEDTSDHYYSGADFHKGVQQINAAQAMGFVRQRRDANDVLFTDLDRTRRQQAFMASVVAAVRHGGALSSPDKLRSLLDVAKQNVAIDAGFDLSSLIPYASAAMNRPVTFYTLPVTDFRTLPDGEDVNIIDADTIRTIVRSLLAGDSPPTTAATTDNARASAHRVALDVINASGQEGAAVAARNALAKGEFTAGAVSNADSIRAENSIVYGTGAQSAAQRLADELGIDASPSGTVAPDTVQLTIGSDFQSSEYVDGMASTSETATTSVEAAPAAVPATAAGSEAPTPTKLSMLTTDGIPCVR
jgi:LCP family protein required for cell wall assembly